MEPFNISEQLYQQELLDHYKRPRNRGRLESAQFSCLASNNACGDIIGFDIIIDNNIIIDIKFFGSGCVISQATASMLTQKIKNQDIIILNNIDKDFIISMIGINLGISRIKCALLSLDALKNSKLIKC